MVDFALTEETFPIIVEELQKACATVDVLRTWFVTHFPDELADNALVGDRLEDQVVYVLAIWARPRGRVGELLQKLARTPPRGHEKLTMVIGAIMHEDFRPRDEAGLPIVEPHRRWFVKGRPFVNRNNLRNHLRALDGSGGGAKCVLVIDGQDGSGKSHSLRLAAECKPDAERRFIDVLDFGKYGEVLDAEQLAIDIAGHRGDEFPEYDRTKEHEAIPGLLSWLRRQLSALDSLS